MNVKEMQGWLDYKGLEATGEGNRNKTTGYVW